MPIPKSLKPLTELLKRQGFRDPEAMANRIAEEGPTELLARLFVRQAWRYAVTPGDSSWIDEAIASTKRAPCAPYSELGRALQECRSRGVPDELLTDLARGVQAAMIFNISYLLEDANLDDPDLQDVAWGLFQVDDDERPLGAQIVAMHELVLAEDPVDRAARTTDG